MRMGRGLERWKRIERTEKRRRKSFKQVARRGVLAFIIEIISGRKIKGIAEQKIEARFKDFRNY
jgi:hypothetical protein